MKIALQRKKNTSKERVARTCREERGRKIVVGLGTLTTFSPELEAFSTTASDHSIAEFL